MFPINVYIKKQGKLVVRVIKDKREKNIIVQSLTEESVEHLKNFTLDDFIQEGFETLDLQRVYSLEDLLPIYLVEENGDLTLRFKRDSTKPRLFLDIDGVFYAYYGGEWQLRPYIVTLTKWASKHFDVYYTSWNSRRSEVVSICYSHGKVISLYSQKEQLQGSKLNAVLSTGGFEGPWIMVDDEALSISEREVLEINNCYSNYLTVPESGMDVLLTLKDVLTNYLESEKLEVPKDWARLKKVNPGASWNDFDLTEKWEGYKNEFLNSKAKG